jgi:hypothetical protein
MAEKEAGELSSKKPMKKAANAVIGILFVALLATGGAAAYLYLQVQELQVDPQVKAQESIDTLIADVGKLIVLPQDELPTVATVSDIELLRDQPFFARGSNGDKVLIYTTAGKAILYSPVSRKIVEVAPINLGRNEINPQEPVVEETVTEEPPREEPIEEEPIEEEPTDGS